MNRKHTIEEYLKVYESLKEIKELLENVDEGNYEYMPKRPQHVIDEEKVDEFKKKLSQISKKELIYLDESGIQSSLVQQYFWMKKGDKKVFKTSGKRGLRLNVLATLTSDGIKGTIFV